MDMFRAPRRLLGAALCLAAWLTAAVAGELPDGVDPGTGYRMDNYRAPTPDTIPGGTVAGQEFGQPRQMPGGVGDIGQPASGRLPVERQQLCGRLQPPSWVSDRPRLSPSHSFSPSLREMPWLP